MAAVAEAGLNPKLGDGNIVWVIYGSDRNTITWIIPAASQQLLWQEPGVRSYSWN